MALPENCEEISLACEELLVRKVVETVRVESAERREVTFKDGKRKVVPISEGK